MMEIRWTIRWKGELKENEEQAKARRMIEFSQLENVQKCIQHSSPFQSSRRQRRSVCRSRRSHGSREAASSISPTPLSQACIRRRERRYRGSLSGSLVYSGPLLPTHGEIEKRLYMVRWLMMTSWRPGVWLIGLNDDGILILPIPLLCVRLFANKAIKQKGLFGSVRLSISTRRWQSFSSSASLHSFCNKLSD